MGTGPGRTWPWILFLQNLIPEILAPSMFAWMDALTLTFVQGTSLMAYFVTGYVTYKMMPWKQPEVNWSITLLSVVPTIAVIILKPKHAHEGESMASFFLRNAICLGPFLYTIVCRYAASLHEELREELLTLKKMRYTLKSA